MSNLRVNPPQDRQTLRAIRVCMARQEDMQHDKVLLIVADRRIRGMAGYKDRFRVGQYWYNFWHKDDGCKIVIERSLNGPSGPYKEVDVVRPTDLQDLVEKYL